MSGWQHAAAVHRSVRNSEQILLPGLQARIAELSDQLADKNQWLANIQQELSETRKQLAEKTAELSAALERLEQEQENPPTYRTPSIRWIKQLIAETYSVPVFDLDSIRRHKDIMTPRQLAIYLARNHTPLSMTKLGRVFGNRDHTTIRHAIERMTKRRLTDPAFDQHVSELEAKIKAEFADTCPESA